jgi:hypothetical protein
MLNKVRSGAARIAWDAASIFSCQNSSSKWCPRKKANVELIGTRKNLRLDFSVEQ